MPGNDALSVRGLLQLAESVRDLQQRREADIEAALDELTTSAVRLVPGARYAGITLARRRREIETPAATGNYPPLLDEIQQRYGEGPCLSAAWRHHRVRIDDLATDQRWPRYRHAAMEQTPIRSILSFRIVGDNRSGSALNFYAEQAAAFDDESVELGRAAATHIALAWTILRRDEQFRSAVASRDVIGQAKGILMERLSIDAAAAFEVLKRLSQESNTPVAEIAQRLVCADRRRLYLDFSRNSATRC